MWPVAELRADCQQSLLALTHRQQALVPASDHLANARREPQRLLSVQARVELLSAYPGQVACVMNGYLFAFLSVAFN